MPLPRPLVRAAGIGLAGLVALAAVGAWRYAARSKRADDDSKRERLREEERAATRRACGLPEGAPLHETVSIQGACQAAVLQAWKSPAGTAAFPGMFDEDGALVTPDGCVTTYRSWIDAPNAYGVNMRQVYVCAYDPRTGLASFELE